MGARPTNPRHSTTELREQRRESFKALGGAFVVRVTAQSGSRLSRERTDPRLVVRGG